MRRRLVFGFSLALGLFASMARAADAPAVAVASGAMQSPLRAVIDVRSNHSDGAHDFATLTRFAEARGIDVLAFTEHDRYSIRLGIEPVPQILGFSMQHPSLYVTGVERFLDDIAAWQKQHPGMLFMAGTESTPGYRWSGIPFVDLTLHDAERHIIALGVSRPEQVKSLPSYDLRHARGPFRLSMVFWCVLVGGVLVMLVRRRRHAVALLLLVSFIAFLATWLMRPAVDADADFIQTARDEGLFTIWAHPGTNSGTRPGPMGVLLDTPPYSQRVFHRPTADAFAAIYGDTDDNTAPGGLWDSFMADYMMGMRPSPIWAVAAGDYHEEGQSGEYLGNYPMDVWAAARTRQAVLAALRAGHMVAWHQGRGQNFRVTELALDAGDGRMLLPGDEATVSAGSTLRMTLGAWPSVDDAMRSKPVRVRLIVDGRVVRQLRTFVGASLAEPLHLEPGAHVVRVDIVDKWPGRMIANPFLVRVKEE